MHHIYAFLKTNEHNDKYCEINLDYVRDHKPNED